MHFLNTSLTGKKLLNIFKYFYICNFITYFSRRLRYKKIHTNISSTFGLWWSGLGISIVVMWYATFVAGWSIIWHRMVQQAPVSVFLHMLRRWANCRAVNSHLINCSITFTVNIVQTQHLARNVQLCTAFANERITCSLAWTPNGNGSDFLVEILVSDWNYCE